jgi:2,4-dienoyl-CoA reductase-like NADH-dependent reductase (Old Yellow Enzyme family)
MKKLFEPAKLGSLEIKNRLVRSATYEIGCIENSAVTSALKEVYDDLAKGEIGLIITGKMSVCPSGGLDGVALYDDSFPGMFAPLADAVHKEGCKIVVQLGHDGIRARALKEDDAPVGPSVFESSGDKPVKALSRDEIGGLIKDFGRAALRCKEGGADGVQLHGAHGYLISEFLSPHFNKRTDEYGGPIENRARFLFEIYDEIRRTVGDFPVLIKINYTDLVDPGITPEEAVWVCEELSKRGIDAIEVSGGAGFNSATSPSQRGFAEEGFFAENAGDVASKISAPVILMGGLRSPEKIEALLNKGNFEAVAICRPLIRDPFLARKWKNGDLSKASCISCSKCFFSKKHGCFLEAKQSSR